MCVCVCVCVEQVFETTILGAQILIRTTSLYTHTHTHTHTYIYMYNFNTLIHITIILATERAVVKTCHIRIIRNSEFPRFNQGSY